MRSALLLLAVALATPAAAEQLNVQVNDRKWNAQVWDGAELYAPLALPTNTPPDLGVCVISVRGVETCIERKDGNTRKSPCQNSYSCTFEIAPASREPFGLLIYDIDVRYDDLVDTVIFVPSASTPPEQTRDIERRLRELADSRTPAFTPLEKDRRQRATQVLTRDQCRDDCVLIQSRIRLK